MSRGYRQRLWRGLGLGWLAMMAGGARAQAPSGTPAPSAAQAPTAPAVIAASSDHADRMTVPVMIDGKGPFAFVIDTGADRTVISRELAARLQLPAGRPAEVHATSGIRVEPTAVLATLQVGPREVKHVEAPLLAQADLGAEGMLGIDSLRGQTMIMDFRARRLLVRKSDMVAAEDPRTIVVHAKSRYGELILVDASVAGQPICVILDSGAQNTVANSALRRLLALRRKAEKPAAPVQVLSVIGGSTDGEFLVVPRATVGGMSFYNLPVAFADLHTFARYDLADRPAMLLGMDVLRAFDRVSVNFRDKAVSFRMHVG